MSYHHLRYRHERVEPHSLISNDSGVTLLYENGTTLILQLGWDERWRAILVVRIPDPSSKAFQTVSNHSVFRFVNASSHSSWLEEA